MVTQVAAATCVFRVKIDIGAKQYLVILVFFCARIDMNGVFCSSLYMSIVVELIMKSSKFEYLTTMQDLAGVVT